MQAPSVSVSLTFDSSQASGVHERKLLAGVNYPATSIAVGRSERGAIMHMKCIVVDDIRISGSTNWSSGGESLQDNELTIISNALIANEAAGRIAEIHAWMLARAA
jgi:phosphatidylserine/phosphatidylglycerophosphate/cardiolipin synthase-like enzyme